MIENLAIEGGGVLGIAEVGAVIGLAKKNLLSGLQRVAGTSAGSIIGDLVAVDCTQDEMYNIMSTVNYENFEDGGDVLGLLTEHQGIHRGHYLQNWIEGINKNKLNKPLATFTDLFKATGVDLKIVASNTTTGNIVVFSVGTTPNVIVSEAVRASMSVPYVFDRFQFTQGVNTTDWYVDGGVAMNYPLPLFDDQPVENTIGIMLRDIHSKGGSINTNGLINSAKAMIQLAINGQALVTLKDARLMTMTKIVDNLGKNSMDFGLSKADATELYQSGLNSV
jgi:NTE family protein